MAVQRLDNKGPEHCTVLKVQFCLVMTVLAQHGPPVVIKKERERKAFHGGGGENTSLLSFKAIRSFQIRLPRSVSPDLSDGTTYQVLLKGAQGSNT